MNNAFLFFIVVLFPFCTLASEASHPSLMPVVKSYQTGLLSAYPDAVFELFHPKKRVELENLGSQVLVALFAELKLNESSFSQVCRQNVCELKGTANKNGRLLNVTYTFVMEKGDYLIANIHSQTID